MPHSYSFSGTSHSPRSDWGDYMDDSETFYEPPFHIGMLTGERSNHLNYTENSEDNFDVSPAFSWGSTASRKPFAFHTDLSPESHREWLCKDLCQWTANDIMDWVINIAESKSYKYEQIPMTSFNVDGLTLRNMTETEFISRAPEFGKELYMSLQNIINGYGYETSQLPAFNPSFRWEEKSSSLMLEEHKEPKTLTDLNVYKVPDTTHMEFKLFDTDPELFKTETKPIKTELGLFKTESGLYETQLTKTESKPLKTEPEISKPLKRLPGRPRGTRSKKKPEKKCGRLWEFIRDLLLNREYCPSLICWDDHNNGVFRFVHSDKVAQLWGTIKENPKMTYEKLSRAMRYYYKSKVLQPVLGRRLVYKFGPTATGWRTPNPNFRLSD